MLGFITIEMQPPENLSLQTVVRVENTFQKTRLRKNNLKAILMILTSSRSEWYKRCMCVHVCAVSLLNIVVAHLTSVSKRRVKYIERRALLSSLSECLSVVFLCFYLSLNPLLCCP